MSIIVIPWYSNGYQAAYNSGTINMAFDRAKGWDAHI